MLLSDLKPKFHHLQSNGAKALLTAVTVLTCACTQAPSLHSDFPVKDSLTIHICQALPYHHIDIFVFADTLTRQLEFYRRFGEEAFLKLPSDGGDKLVVALADVRGSFGALPDRYSTMERLTMRYADEDPEAPLQAGQGSAETGRTVELNILPLLCPVSIRSISIAADAPLCGAVVQLERVNASAEILRTDGFHPSATINSPAGLDFPMMMLREFQEDIASVPTPTGITLWCYPNEDGDGPGGGGTRLLVTGSLSGERKAWRIPLGKIRRGARLELDITLKNDYLCEL